MESLAEGSIVARRYELRRLLGHGGMGMVYLARDRWLATNVAIKVIVPGPEPEEDIDRFHLEARALALVDSRHVVKLHSFGRSSSTCYYTMDYIEGATIDQILTRDGGPLTFDFAVSTMRDVGRGLEEIHRAGFIHRDVKPSNILLEHRTRRAVLFDLGLVFPWRTDARASGGVGSPAYMAPEQSGCAFEPGSDEIGPWTDEYSLACTGFEMLAGRPPFDGDCIGALLRKHMLSRPPRLSSFRPDLECVDHIFMRALAKAPAERYGSASAMVRALAAARPPRSLWARARSLFPSRVQTRSGIRVASRT